MLYAYNSYCVSKVDVLQIKYLYQNQLNIAFMTKHEIYSTKLYKMRIKQWHFNETDQFLKWRFY